MVPFTNLKAQYASIKPEIDQAIDAVFESGQFVGGPFVTQFESDFAALHRASDCVAVGNGTDAILIALKSFDLEPGDEVIVPAFGWISAAEMVTLAGASPVFADVLPDGTLDPVQAEAKIRTRTRGIICMHLYGQAARAHALQKLCASHHLFLIEDCAQAHLTREMNQPVGTIGDAGTFSFYPTKNLGAYGDAGCIFSNEAPRMQKMRLFANHGGLHQHIMEGVNSRMDPMQAAVLSVKCRHLPSWTEKRIQHACQYVSLLKGVSEIILPETRTDTKHTFHQFVIRTARRNDLQSFLGDHGIQTLIHYSASLPNLPAYSRFNYAPADFPEATRCQGEVLSLPVYPELKEDEIKLVSVKIMEFFTGGA